MLPLIVYAKSVSYTHLDVYKRQEVSGPNNINLPNLAYNDCKNKALETVTDIGISAKHKM